jgi:hypothetical protein
MHATSVSFSRNTPAILVKILFLKIRQLGAPFHRKAVAGMLPAFRLAGFAPDGSPGATFLKNR